MPAARVLPNSGGSSAKLIKPKAIKPTQEGVAKLSGSIADSTRDNANVLQGLDIDEDNLDYVMEQIQDVLNAKKVRVKDLFLQFDDDDSGLISRKEFIKSMQELGLEASAETIGGIFDTIDRDLSGTIKFDEFSRAGLRAKNARLASNAPMQVQLRKRAELRKANSSLLEKCVLLTLDGDVLDSQPDQIRAGLYPVRKVLVEYLKLSDDDGSGSLSFAEFVRALHDLGLPQVTPRVAIKAVYDAP